MEKLKEQFSSFQIAKRCALTEDPTYLLDIDISRGEGSHLLAVSCSNKSVRVYNRETLSLLQEYSSQPALLSGVRFAHACEGVLFSACSDGTVKCWDMRLSTPEPVQLFCGYPSNVFVSFDVSCNDLIVCAGTEKVEDDVFMAFWDARGCTNSASSRREPLGFYSESHNDDITKICFHPNKPNLVVSGSTDGLVNVFDINKDNEGDALLSTLNSDSSVSFIGWSGKEYWQVYCMTHDEGFCWWDLTQLDTEDQITLLHISDAREVVSIDDTKLNYLIGGLYHETSGKLFVVGGMSTGNIHLMDCCATGLRPVGTLQGGHSATVRSFYWNMEDNSLLTGGEDAQLLLWKPGAVEKAFGKKTSLKTASSVHQRVRVHQNTFKNQKK
ncbi:WD repeat-containing protein 89 [Hemicordylus capensis]|uniref:WD repeat-containing protein 89 n=1 Tax=Hemicordylus capensis TaxID=884348 RepID=UPI0023024751|nr:WD repeat-containing protein 89 [Hemicordylus capensis]XP_053143420.1 WD repeat-containing protein 89 [Hemicordylus capensis]XP_053143421.1 WD repeat-containing protein 89 [Hemicordylus capensis]XP_053143422.1 WD repeat-containing protein 89 [Hemicordylus capensis]